jgi:hypothetical protein
MDPLIKSNEKEQGYVEGILTNATQDSLRLFHVKYL